MPKAICSKMNLPLKLRCIKRTTLTRRTCSRRMVLADVGACKGERLSHVLAKSRDWAENVVPDFAPFAATSHTASTRTPNRGLVIA